MSRNSRRLVRILTDRPHAQGAEVGVFQGDTSVGLLEGLPGLERLMCIDLWRQDRDFMRHSPNKKGVMYNANWTAVRRRFAEQVGAPYAGRVWSMEMTSLAAAQCVPDGTLDFVFLDANHGYEFIKGDAQAWWPKVKDGGVVAGDDYCDKPTYGVIRALTELLPGRHKTNGPIWWAEKTEGRI